LCYTKENKKLSENKEVVVEELNHSHSEDFTPFGTICSSTNANENYVRFGTKAKSNEEYTVRKSTREIHFNLINTFGQAEDDYECHSPCSPNSPKFKETILKEASTYEQSSLVTENMNLMTPFSMNSNSRCESSVTSNSFAKEKFSFLDLNKRNLLFTIKDPQDLNESLVNI
jgi:hypothetical protein